MGQISHIEMLFWFSSEKGDVCYSVQEGRWIVDGIGYATFHPAAQTHHTNEDIYLLSSSQNITRMEEGCSMVWRRCFVFLLQRLRD